MDRRYRSASGNQCCQGLNLGITLQNLCKDDSTSVNLAVIQSDSPASKALGAQVWVAAKRRISGTMYASCGFDHRAVRKLYVSC